MGVRGIFSLHQMERVIAGLQTTDRLAVYKFNENGTMEQVSFVDEIERPTCIVF